MRRPQNFAKSRPYFCLKSTVDKSKVEISQNFAAFSEYTNFNISYSKLEIEAKKNFF